MIDGFMDGFLPFVPVLVLVVVLGIVTVVIAAFFKKTSRSEGPDYSAYRLDPYLLSKAEYSFYQVLRQILGNQYDVFAKVRLADIVKVKGGEGFQSAFNRIASKHIDFVICDKTSKVLLVVELDDASHRRAQSEKSDRFKDGLFEAVGLRCVRFKAQRSYNVEDIKRALLDKPVEKPAEITA